MALFPCDSHGARYTGSQQTIYPALLSATDTERGKMRLCPACFGEAVQFAQLHFEEVGVTEEKPQTVCSVCEVPDPGTAVFVTVYANRAERRDFYGRLCGECTTTARLLFLGRKEPILRLAA